MPPTRGPRRAVTDENAENGGSIRLTRAKAAALDNTTAGDPPKKALATKRSNTTATNGTLASRKRTALGDVSNVAKKENAESSGDGKKDTLGKPATLSKASKPTGIQKQPARTSSTRTVLGQKTTNTASSSELKRPASGSGVGGQVVKKRNISTSKLVKEEDDESSENVPPPKNGSTGSLKRESQTTLKSTIKMEESIEVDDEEEEEEEAFAEDGGVSFEELMREAEDLDDDDAGDPLMVSEYVHEIFAYMKQLEIATLPNPDYMEKQGELEWKMRGILVDWLLEVHTRFRLLPETLFLAVNIIDRFLSCKAVQLDRLQLVGVTAMFIASKYEEVLSPHIQNFVHVADEGFSEQEILSAERFLLSSLNYDLSYPNPMNFLRRISKADNYDIQTRTFGKYLLEIGCLDHRFLKYPPSLVAAAAMYLARMVLDRGEWDATLSKYAGYTEQQILPVFRLMVDYLHAPVAHEAFFKKYASKKFLKASIVMRTWAKQWASTYLPTKPSQSNSEKLSRFGVASHKVAGR